MFLDEFGDHNLRVIGAYCPLFALGGVIMAADWVRGVVTPRMLAFKRDCSTTETGAAHSRYRAQPQGF
jgi:hypothetical protein